MAALRWFIVPQLHFMITGVQLVIFAKRTGGTFVDFGEAKEAHHEKDKDIDDRSSVADGDVGVCSAAELPFE